MKTHESTHHPRLIRLPEVVARVGLCRSSIYSRIGTGRFPAPRKLGRASVWVEHEITEWISHAIKGADSHD